MHRHVNRGLLTAALAGSAVGLGSAADADEPAAVPIAVIPSVVAPAAVPAVTAPAVSVPAVVAPAAYYYDPFYPAAYQTYFGYYYPAPIYVPAYAPVVWTAPVAPAVPAVVGQPQPASPAVVPRGEASADGQKR